MTGRAPRTVLVVAAAGGCGSSVLAGAIALARQRAGEATWLVEMESGRGDLADAWDLAGDRTLDDLRPVLPELAPHHLVAARREHPSGLSVLVAAREPGPACWDAEGAGRIVEVVATTAGEGGAAVVDGGTGLGASARGAADAVERVLLVCPPRVAAARRALAIAEGLTRSAGAAGCGLVVAAGPGRAEIGTRALSRAVGVRVEAEIPWSAGEAAELGAGRWPRGRAGRGLRGVVEGLVASWA